MLQVININGFSAVETAQSLCGKEMGTRLLQGLPVTVPSFQLVVKERRMPFSFIPQHCFYCL